MAGSVSLPSGPMPTPARRTSADAVPGAAARAATGAPPINGQRLTMQGEARQRLVVLLLLFLAVPLLLALRLTDLAVFEATPASTRNVASAAPPRADVVDRNGVELARTFEAYAISVEPRKLAGNPAVLARRIAAILADTNEAEILAELTHKGQFRYIARRVLPTQAKRINDIGEPAIYLRREAERLYPNFNLASHVIGYTSDKGRGMVGLEKAFDARLSAKATRSQPLATALDVRVQQALENELRSVFEDQRADGAAGIVMDVTSGEVVAMTSQPDFNPNAPGQSDNRSRYNQATFATFELGSTFKAFTIANGLDTGVIPSMTKTWDATRPLVVDRKTIHDDHALNRWLNAPDVFIHSSNIGTARIAAEIGRDAQRNMLDKLGFFKQMPFELQERSRPQFPPLSNWGQLATMTIGYGHGISVTPLHLAAGYAALVNGGIFHAPTIVKVAPGTTPPGHRVFSEQTSETMRKLLRLVVTKGTGRKADAPGYRVGGKTGTAEKVENGRYVHGQNVSTFASAFPMDAPRYVVVLMIDNPKGSKASFGFKTAGMTIAPATARLIARIGPLLGVQPDAGRDLDLAAVTPAAADAVEE
jgi:cell division protein FtsI (penicillin-binding protein 3)